jgi:hypothetical protein
MEDVWQANRGRSTSSRRRSWDAIVEYNCLRDPDHLEAGTTLIIP